MRIGVLLRGSGRDPGVATLAARGVVLLVALVLVVAGLVLVGRGTFTDSVDAVVLVDDAGGSLTSGADVKYHGVIVGQVTSLTRAGSGPGVRVAIFINLLGALRAFDIIYVITGGGPVRSTETVGYFMYRESMTQFKLGYGAAATVVLLVAVLIISIPAIVQRTAGAR